MFGLDPELADFFQQRLVGHSPLGHPVECARTDSVGRRRRGRSDRLDLDLAKPAKLAIRRRLGPQVACQREHE